MKHSGKARKAAFKIIVISAIAVAVIWALGAIGAAIGTFIMAVAVAA